MVFRGGFFGTTIAPNPYLNSIIVLFDYRAKVCENFPDSCVIGDDNSFRISVAYDESITYQIIEAANDILFDHNLVTYPYPLLHGEHY